MFRRAMPLCKTLNSSSVAGGLVGALHVRLLVLLPGYFLAFGRAVERALAPCARYGGGGIADVAFASRLEDRLNFDQLQPCRTSCA